MQQSGEPAARQVHRKEDAAVTELDNRQGDEIIIIIRNGVVVKFEQRKFNLENGSA